MDSEDNRRTLGPAVALWAIGLGLAAWPAVYLGAYVCRSAIAAFAFYHILCLAGGALHRMVYGFREPGPLGRRGWLGLAVAGLAVCAATYSALGSIGLLIEPARVSHALASLGLPNRPMAEIALFSYFALVNPTAEELFWRGGVYAQLRAAGWGIGNSAVVSALLFGSWHWLIIRLLFRPEIALAATVGVGVVGWCFALLYERLRSLPALIAIHALAADIPLLIVLWFGVLARRGG